MYCSTDSNNFSIFFVGLFEAFAYNQETSQPTSNSVNQQLYDYCSHHLISELHLRYNDDNIDLVIPEAENLLRQA